MGKYVDGIHGAFTGKVGNIIGSSWRGIPYMKSRPVRTKPPTEKEKQNRYIFAMTQEWLYPLTNFLRIGFKNYTHTNQGVNAAKSYLHKHALVRNGYDSVIDPTLMKVSHGNLPFPDRMEVEQNNESELVFTWEPARSGSDNEFDQVLLLAYDIENGVAEMSLNGQFRNTGRDVLEIDTLKNFVVYAAFVSADRSSQSDSVYLGSFTKIEKKETSEQNASSKKEAATDNKTTADSGNTKTTTPDNKTTTTSENIAAVASDNTTKDENKLPEIAGGESIALSGDAAEPEYVPENQLSLFDFSDEKIEDKAEKDGAVLLDETVLTDIPPLGSSDLTETETKVAVNQKFVYINPDAVIEDEKTGLSVKVDLEADKKGKKGIKLKKDRLTVFATEEQAEELKREGYEVEFHEK